MQLKRIIPYVVVGGLGILLINLIASNSLLLGDAARCIEASESIKLHMFGTLYCFLLGVLLEWRTVVRLIKKETRLSFTTLFISGIAILLISCISPIIFTMIFGINAPFPYGISLVGFLIGPLSQSSSIHNLLAIVAGSIIIRGMSKNMPGI